MIKQLKAKTLCIPLAHSISIPLTINEDDKCIYCGHGSKDVVLIGKSY
jgi:hypothetical protein